MNDTVQKIEAILFTSGSPVQKNYLKKVLKCDDRILEDALRNLAERREGSGVMVVDSGSQIALMTNPSLSGFVETVQKEEQGASLSRAAQETLAIIAYAGPIAKVDLDFLRGVNTHYTLRRLAMRGLIQDERHGQRRVVTITVEFLSHLGIATIETLPDYVNIRTTILDSLRKVKERTAEREV